LPELRRQLVELGFVPGETADDDRKPGAAAQSLA
jgi:hypothetical protein